MTNPKSQPTKVKQDNIFIYECINKYNRKTNGEIKAKNIQQAKNILKKQGFSVKKLKQKPKPLFNLSKHTTVSSYDITIFFRQMATMSAAGIPIIKSFDVIIEGSDNNGVKFLVTEVKAEVESGISLSSALKKQPKYFDELVCNLIESGEQSGTLEIMLDRIAHYKERNESLKRKVRKAIFYPAAILVVSFIVSIILLVKVVPTFQKMFDGFNAELPRFTQIVINLSETIQMHGLKMGVIIALCISFFIYLYRNNKATREMVQRFILKIPIIGGILHKSIIARFARTLATTFSAGVPLTNSLTSVARAANNVVYYRAIIKIRDAVSSGQQMYFAMKKEKVFPNMVVQMIGIGEESGSLDSMLEKVANIYEEEVNTLVDGLTTLLEPLVMVVLGLVVGSLVVAMYLPIFKLGTVL